MTELLHTAAAEDHEAAAKLHRIAAALAVQGKVAACSEMAVRAGALAGTAARASAFAAAKSTQRLVQDRSGATPSRTGETMSANVSSRLEAPKESLGIVVRDGTSRRRFKPWIVI